MYRTPLRDIWLHMSATLVTATEPAYGNSANASSSPRNAPAPIPPHTAKGHMRVERPLGLPRFGGRLRVVVFVISPNPGGEELPLRCRRSGRESDWAMDAQHS